MAIITDYTRQEILDSYETDLTTLVPATVKTVTQEMKVRTIEELRKRFAAPQLPVCVIVDVPGDQSEGKVSGITGRSPTGRFTTDYLVGLIFLAELNQNQKPQDIVIPIYKKVFEVVLGNRSRSGNAIDTQPDSTTHTGRQLGNRIAASMVFVSPFEWQVK